ncbi:hypothetical protein GGI13_002900, partial [Coemansia sp. RSA 455]
MTIDPNGTAFWGRYYATCKGATKELAFKEANDFIALHTNAVEPGLSLGAADYEVERD